MPASQRVQLSCLTLGLTVPGAQSVAFAEPTGQNVPMSHGMQSSALVITLIAEFIVVPPGQGSGAAEPSAQ